MRIERARTEDCERILELQKLCFRGEAERTGDFDIPPLLETLEECRAACSAMVMLKGVAEASDAVPEGFAPGDIIAAGRIRFDGKTGHIGRLVMEPDFRGRGLGRAMLTALEDACTEAERFELFTGHASFVAISLYRSAGYEIYSSKPVSPSLSLVYMEKKVPFRKAAGEGLATSPQDWASNQAKDTLPPASFIGPIIADSELPIDHEAYHELWRRMPPLELTMVRKDGECSHEVGTRFTFENPYSKPQGLCNAMLHVASLYLWRATLGFPSWNPADKRVHVLHCPDVPGTVWELRAKTERPHAERAEGAERK